VCVCVCVCLYLYVCVSISMSVHLIMFVYLSVFVSVCVCVLCECVSKCVHAAFVRGSVCVREFVYVPSCMFVCDKERESKFVRF